mmetsp:Transcript_12437/g.39380  ORF Transcript_12437/g.39380 Transcript_12437/m.39380 type:complete len:331 (-) Transcript_12437:107-1099(-)
MWESARESHPGSRLVLLTDRGKDELKGLMPRLGPDVELRHVASQGNRSLVMKERMAAELQLIRDGLGWEKAHRHSTRAVDTWEGKEAHKSYRLGSWDKFGRRLLATRRPTVVHSAKLQPHLVFVDTDILFTKNLGALFKEDFAIALTYRDHKELPINLGVKIVHGAHLAEAAHVWQAFVDAYESIRQCFTCDQRAVAKVMKENTINGKIKTKSAGTHTVTVIAGPQIVVQDEVRRTQARVRMLHCSAWNVVPGTKNSDCSPKGDGASMAFIHFKGAKKDEMAEYWKMLQDKGAAAVASELRRSKGRDRASVRREKTKEGAGKGGAGEDDR